MVPMLATLFTYNHPRKIIVRSAVYGDELSMKPVFMPCQKYLIQHISGDTSLLEYAKFFFQICKLQGISEQEASSLYAAGFAASGRNDVNCFSFKGTLLPSDEFIRAVMSDRNIPSHRSCNAYGKTLLKDYSQICYTCPFSKQYANRFIIDEFSLLKFINESSDNLFYFSEVSAGIEPFISQIDLANDLMVDEPTVCQLTKLCYEQINTRGSSYYSGNLSFEERLMSLLPSLVVAISEQAPSIEQIRSKNPNALSIIWQDIVRQILDSPSLNPDSAAQKLAFIKKQTATSSRQTKKKTEEPETQSIFELIETQEAKPAKDAKKPVLPKDDTVDSASAESEPDGLPEKGTPEFWHFVASHDELTSLLNKYAYEQHLEKADPSNCTIFFFDINNLKETNDTQGHSVGNRLIMATAKCLSAVFEKHAYRIGGDEFTVLLPYAVSDEAAGELIDKFRSSLSRIEQDDPDHLSYMVSVGFCYGDGNLSLQEIHDTADERMYKDKQEYKASVAAIKRNSLSEIGMPTLSDSIFMTSPHIETSLLRIPRADMQTLKMYFVPYKELENEYFEYVRSRKQISLEVIATKEQLYLLLWFPTKGLFLYASLFNLPETLKILLTHANICKICWQPFVLYSQMRKQSLLLKTVHSILTTEILISPNHVCGDYTDTMYAYAIGKHMPKRLSSRFPLLNNYVSGMQLYTYIYTAQTRGAGMITDVDYQHMAFRNEVLGLSFMRSFYLNDKSTLFDIDRGGEFAFNHEYILSAKQQGFIVTYQVDKEDMMGYTPLDFYLMPLLQMAKEKRFKKIGLQVISISEDGLLLFIEYGHYELTTTLIQKFYDKLALQMHLPKFELHVSTQQVDEPGKEIRLKKQPKGTVSDVLDNLITSNVSIEVADKNIKGPKKQVKKPASKQLKTFPAKK